MRMLARLAGGSVSSDVTETNPAVSLYSLYMLVANLDHFIDCYDDLLSARACGLADHLVHNVRAATAADVRTAWISALPCRRRPGNRS